MDKQNVDPIEERINQLSDEDIQRALQVFKDHIRRDYAVYLQSCVHCGLCADSCHYALTSDENEAIPAHKLELVTSVFKKIATLSGRVVPGLVGARDLDREMLSRWVDSLFGRCSLCGRCTLNCSIGINISYLIRVARGALNSLGLVPAGLQKTIDTALEKGNNMGIASADWLETVNWIEGELQDEVNDPLAKLPVDVKGADFLYTVNPREPMFFPLSILAVGKIFYAAEQSWTFSSDNYDVTNYGLYHGDDEEAGIMSNRLVESMETLGCKTLVLAECGHGFNANRWEAPEWLKKKYGFEVKSILEIIAEYVRDGRIEVDPEKNKIPATLHDPCNLVRLGGVVDEQRYILSKTVSQLIEMVPNREQNYCCGGGGGQLAMSRFTDRRLKAGKLKADQIQKTAAGIVATPCHNCIDQLMELNKEYKMGVEIKTVGEIAADALVLPGKAAVLPEKDGR